MIVYGRGTRIYETLFRIHGSALYKGVLPGLISTAILLILVSTAGEPTHELDDRWFSHPYPISAMIAAFTFLLTFKCSFSYNRYWEACTSIFQMQSKWLDAGLQLAAWHLQSSRYSQIKPPSFGEHPGLNSEYRKRTKEHDMTPDKLREMLMARDDSKGTGGNSQDLSNGPPGTTTATTGHEKGGESLSFMMTTTRRGSLQRKSSFWQRHRRPLKKLRSNTHTTVPDAPTATTKIPPHHENGRFGKSIHSQSSVRSFPTSTTCTFQKQNHTINNTTDMEPTPFHHQRNLSHIVSVTNLDGGMDHDEYYPSPFLQEASHLLSLLCAVAFTTLRNDLQRAPAPLCEYQVGSPWPPVDPDADKSRNYYEMNSFLLAINYLLGNVRTDAQRTVYNSCRPLKVLGGVSDAEIDMLQRARGPVAKMSLCVLWVQEFVSREFEAGALGKTAPPIVSRVFQVLSDGTLGYNQARKVAYVPFPFPHTQLTTFYIVVITLFMPILMLTFVNDTIAAAVTNFFTVGVFLGLWHVSNELEDPFRNVPNDLPLNTFQAQFNEALVVMFAGFHPEAWWDITDKLDGITPSDISQCPPPPSSSSPAPPSSDPVSSTTHDETSKEMHFPIQVVPESTLLDGIPNNEVTS